MTLAALVEHMKPATLPPVEIIVNWSGALDAQRMRQARAGVPCQQRVTFSLVGKETRDSLYGSGLGAACKGEVSLVNRGTRERG